MTLTDKQRQVLQQAPINGVYLLPLGPGMGRWMWLCGDEPVTRQVNVLLRQGLLSTDAAPAGNASNHPPSEAWSAVAIRTDAGNAALAAFSNQPKV